MKYSVLTYLFGDYEFLHEILEKDPEAEYICVTDNQNLQSDTWTIVYEPMPDFHTGFDKAFYVRYNPFKFVHTDIVIKIDGSIIVKKSLAPIIDKFNEMNKELCIMIHPERNIMRDEYIKWIQSRGYPVDAANKALSMMTPQEYAISYKGLYQLTLSIQRNTEFNTSLNESTYAIVKRLGNGSVDRLDQTIFSYVINRYFGDPFADKIMPVSENIITDSDYMTWCHHHSSFPIINKTNKIKPYLLNKEIDTVEFPRSNGL